MATKDYLEHLKFMRCFFASISFYFFSNLNCEAKGISFINSDLDTVIYFNKIFTYKANFKIEIREIDDCLSIILTNINDANIYVDPLDDCSFQKEIQSNMDNGKSKEIQFTNYPDLSYEVKSKLECLRSEKKYTFRIPNLESDYSVFLYIIVDLPNFAKFYELYEINNKLILEPSEFYKKIDSINLKGYDTIYLERIRNNSKTERTMFKLMIDEY